MSTLKVDQIKNIVESSVVDVSDIASKNAFIASSGSSLVGFKANGVGAVDGTVQNKLREVVSPEDFGAVGDGVANDRAAMLAALQYACSTGISFKAPGNKTYLLQGAALVVPNTANTPVLIDFGGSKVIGDNTGISIDGPSGYPFLTTNLSVNPVKYDAKIVLTSTVGIQQGDLIEISSPALMHGSILTLHYYIVSEVNGNDVYIEGNVCGDINPTQVTDSGQTGSIVVSVFRLAPGITIQNGSFHRIDTAGTGSMFTIQRHFRVLTDNLILSGHARGHIQVYFCGHTLHSHIYSRDFGYLEKDVGYVNPPSAPGGLAFGYGIALARNYSSVVRDCVGGHGWHFADIARGQMYSTFDNVSISRNGYGLQSHGGAWNATYRNCEFKGTSGMACEGVNHVVIDNCQFLSTKVHGVTLGGTSISMSIKNCKFVIGNSEYTNYAVYFAGGAPPNAGGRSLNDMYAWEFSSNTVIGSALVTLGSYVPSGYDSIMRVSNNLCKKCSITVTGFRNTFIIGNSTEDVQTNAFRIASAGADVTPVNFVVANNHVTGSHTSGGTGYLIAIEVQATNISVVNNTNTLSGFLSASNGIVVNTVSHNVHHATGFMFPLNNTVTLSNVLYNQYKQYLNYQTVITNSVGNIDMV